mmetsp:Transcript_29237/g.45801  ORF Transcript_29237/g.45801 Transcript_29237/m.45801 type:complete len:147 (-) Transcript_29237:855-1295(-)
MATGSVSSTPKRISDLVIDTGGSTPKTRDRRHVRIESVLIFLGRACHSTSFRNIQDVYLQNLSSLVNSNGATPKFTIGVMCIGCLNWMRRNTAGSFCERRKERSAGPVRRVIAKHTAAHANMGLFRNSLSTRINVSELNRIENPMQ